MDNAQNIGNWGENQMEIANARIPYASTLLQTGYTPNTPNEYGLAMGGKKGDKPIPGAPANPSPQPFVRGEKQWMDNAANINTWGDQQMTVANTRIPYASTLQLRDDDPNNIETMSMEQLDLPLNGYLVHVETKEGDELMRIVQ